MPEITSKERKYHPKHVEKFTDINKLCNVASCCINEYIGILLGARPILHISRLKVNVLYFKVTFTFSLSEMRKFHHQGDCFLPQSNNIDFQDVRWLLNTGCDNQ
jgi:hypothetical protein